ncbi:acyl carrier protein [Streptomyces bobili]|uniref:acyl carrier protein n=1 Tax=Streptomyces bobili TaxID=67280 RepID=UPI0033F1B856
MNVEPSLTERRLIDEVIAPLLGFAPTELDRDLTELGVNSLKILHILDEAETLFAVEFTPADLRTNLSVAGICAVIDRS